MFIPRRPNRSAHTDDEEEDPVDQEVHLDDSQPDHAVDRNVDYWQIIGVLRYSRTADW